MLLLLILPVWALGLLLVAGLCFTARLGDSEQSRIAALLDEQRPKPVMPGDAAHAPAPAIGAERVTPALARREIAA